MNISVSLVSMIFSFSSTEKNGKTSLYEKKKIVLTTVHCKSSNVNRVRLMNLIR